MVFGDGQFYRGFGGYWVFWFMGCISAFPCQFGTDLALVEYWSWSGLMKLRHPPFDFVTEMLILPNSGN